MLEWISTVQHATFELVFSHMMSEVPDAAKRHKVSTLEHGVDWLEEYRMEKP